MNKILIAAALASAFGLASAKLPAPDDAAKAKAAETAAKAAWQGKVDAYALCKAQDKVAAAYAKSSGKPVPAPAKAAASAKPAASAAAKPAASMAAAKPASAAVAAAKPASGASAAAAPAGTPVAFAPPPACADPGPFAYNQPAQKPLETSGAHSPAGTAASPPSVKADSAQMAPATPKK